MAESDEQRYAEEIRAWAESVPGSVRIAGASARSRVKLAGVVRRITVRPLEGNESLEAILSDGAYFRYAENLIARPDYYLSSSRWGLADEILEEMIVTPVTPRADTGDGVEAPLPRSMRAATSSTSQNPLSTHLRVSSTNPSAG